MPSPLRIAVVGAGAFGRNHLRVLNELQHPSPINASDPTPEQNPLTGQPPLTPNCQLRNSSLTAQPNLASMQVQLTAAVDRSPAARAQVVALYSIPTFATVDDLIAADLDLHAAIVAVPTVHHAQVATQLLEANLDVLIEKPLSNTVAEADSLIALAEEKGRILAAGHLERFNPSVTAALQHLTRPMFFEAHRLSVFTPRSLDVDVVLDLMIHDLDILLTMANAPVAEIRAVGLPVLSRKVDIANVRLEFASGAIANLTASRISTEQVRKLRLFQPAQYLSLDYARQELLTINVDPTLAPALAATFNPLSRPSHVNPGSNSGDTVVPQPHPSAGLNFEKLELSRVEPLKLEIEDFLRAVQTRNSPRVTAEAGRQALALALDINAAIAAHAAKTGITRKSLTPFE